MAQESFQMPPLNSETETEIRDAEGNRIDSFRATDGIALDEDNHRIQRAWHEARITSDGFAWHPGMLQAGIHIGQCALCASPPWTFPSRSRPTTGLVRIASAVHCGRCGRLLCPRHRREVDGKVLCIPCARRRRFWRLLDRIFFAREEEA